MNADGEWPRYKYSMYKDIDVMVMLYDYDTGRGGGDKEAEVRSGVE